MRLLLISFFCLLLTSFAFAGEKLVIKDSIISRQSVTPDIMVASVAITANDKTFQSASSRIEKAVSIVKSNSSIAEYKSYRINPVYSYHNNERKLTGYSAYLHVPCEFKDIADFSSFLNDINSLNSAKNIYEISVSQVNWAISETTRETILTALKMRLIKLLSLKSVEFSIASEKECSVALIDYTNSTPSFPRMETAGLRSAKLSITPPNQSDIDISVSAFYKLICE